MFHVFWFSKKWAEKIETSASLSAIFIFCGWFSSNVMWRVGGAEYCNYSINIVLSSSYSSHYISHKIWPQNMKMTHRNALVSIFFSLNFLKIKIYQPPLEYLNWLQEGTVGKSLNLGKSYQPWKQQSDMRQGWRIFFDADT